MDLRGSRQPLILTAEPALASVGTGQCEFT